MGNTHVGFIVVKILTADEPDSSGTVYTLEQLQELAIKSGGTMWVLGKDLLTYQALEATNRLKLDS